MSNLLANLSPPDATTQYILLAAVALFMIWVILRPRGKKGKDPLTPGPKFSLAQHRAVERQMSDLLVELSEMARQITAQLDTRAAKLELLIKDADERIAELRSLGESGATLEPRPRDKWSVKGESVARLPERGLQASPSEGPQTVTSSDADPRHAAVYLLADQGRSAAEIARQLGRPGGEIELILALRANS
jgi:hypothetical protein